MADFRPSSFNPMLSCPACFAREIDPIFLRHDDRTGEYYCLKCTYVAPDEATVHAFYADLRRLRYRMGKPVIPPGP